ncbi:signal peptide-domain containing protein [Rhodopirellula maiorica SM1]|uniref:Signal peptide-domain containing protein n=1 Tax=Rhodopirellula maiorica SM1 TaxID=1265738 RepID=M5RTK5_9BACT|nr:MerC domain-containing protein [Rhodopirellula maiorica]EMI22630.1 signal peptide-domain containing protein [Rhodopirellula maiorica SM1]
MSGELPMVDTLSDGPTTQAAPASWSGWSDCAGMVASIGCAIHCAAMPFVIAYLPALGLSFLADEAFHKWMAIGCFVIALSAFVPGVRKHGRLTPVVVGSIGLVLISIAAFGFAGECCAVCANTVAPDAFGASTPTGNAVSSVTAEVCTDACCVHCASDGAAAEVDTSFAGLASVGLPSNSLANSSWVARLAPWMTPVGGIVLVCAHLLNRRYGCRCGCCENDVSKVSA